MQGRMRAKITDSSTDVTFQAGVQFGDQLVNNNQLGMLWYLI